MVREQRAGVGDDAVREATGRAPEEWFALLDAAGATGWTHTAIAHRLAEEGVPSWWAQGVAVRYEQARGLRLPGQQADGTFSVSVTRRLHGDLARGYAHVVARFSAELGAAPSSARAEGARPSARWSLDEGSVLVTVEVAGVAKLRVSAVHERLRDPAAADAARERLRGVLDALSR